MSATQPALGGCPRGSLQCNSVSSNAPTVCSPVRNVYYWSAAFALQVCQVKELDHWMLYLVDWGYNTKQEREEAAGNPRIHVVNHQELSQAIRQ